MMLLSQGTGDKFDEKYNLYSKMLYRVCMVYLGNHEKVEDAMQEAFIKLLYKSPGFRNDQDERQWLVRVAINICKDFLGSAWHKNNVSIESVGEMSCNDEINDIFHTVQKLPEKYKTVIYLHYTEEFSVNEISKILKIGNSAVKARLKRARDMLRKEIGEE